MESIVFHARKSADDKTPIYTVRFGMEKQFGDSGTLFCVVSKPHPQLEAYSKKVGNHITEARLDKLKEEFDNGSVKTVVAADLKLLKQKLPRGSAKVLSFYADRARRYFKLDDPKIIIRGTDVSWDRTEIGNKAKKETIVMITNLNSITPKE